MRALSDYNSQLGGSLAQSVEHCTFNAVVIGSNPIRPTIIFKGLQVFPVSLFCFVRSLCVIGGRKIMGHVGIPAGASLPSLHPVPASVQGALLP